MSISRRKYICRIDQPSKSSHGWYCRVLIKNRKGVRKLHAKFFSDKVCGSKRKAFEAAESHRDALVAARYAAA
jgi:hypothetical protein